MTQGPRGVGPDKRGDAGYEPGRATGWASKRRGDQLNATPIARGRTADVFAWDHDRVLKVIRPEFGLKLAEIEAEIATQVGAAGIDCPRFFGLTEFRGRPALIYERIEGEQMAGLGLRRPWRVPALARRMARLHLSMHASPFGGQAPSLRARLGARIADIDALSGELKARLLDRVARVPDGDRLCHGDFHPENVLCARGRDVAIDWLDVAVGHPHADVARTSIILLGAAASTGNPLLTVVAKWFHSEYLRAYFGSERNRDVYRAILPVVAAARLGEGIEEQRDWLLDQASKCE